MADANSIRVHVVRYPGRKNLTMRRCGSSTAT